MEQHEISLIEKYSVNDTELKALWDLHLDYERQIQALLAKGSLSQSEENDLKELKKKKLAGKTRLIQIIDRYKENA